MTPTTAPIVLVHGILGFDQLLPGDSGLFDYFREIVNALRNAGYTVPHPPRLDPAGTIAQRAQNLNDYLGTPELAGQAVHIIAHSMGGLDSRFLISQLGMADRVLSLTTLGTPHQGTPFADIGVASLGDTINRLGAVGVNLRGFFDLTTQAAIDFNNANPNAPQVRYRSIAGEFDPTSLDLLKEPHDVIIEHEGGANDGLVPVQSAQFGDFLGTWPADHFRLVNWGTNLALSVPELFDRSIVERYLDLAKLVTT